MQTHKNVLKLEHFKIICTVAQQIVSDCCQVRSKQPTELKGLYIVCPQVSNLAGKKIELQCQPLLAHPISVSVV